MSNNKSKIIRKYERFLDRSDDKEETSGQIDKESAFYKAFMLPISDEYIIEHDSSKALQEGIQSFIDVEKDEEKKKKLIEIKNSIK